MCSNVAKSVLLLGVVLGMAAPALGVTYEFSESQVLAFGKIAIWSNDLDSFFEVATTDNDVYGATHDL